ncbi:hypothetical protein [Bacillus sp. AFS053548]|uniref:hypothetical protein n=1 Tax=Bacillus sp. AFS053548 TaxID=2033505 RepID=UPI00159BCCDF|nr:hypothetical protein [Bacillus sp. AFS053548]
MNKLTKIPNTDKDSIVGTGEFSILNHLIYCFQVLIISYGRIAPIRKIAVR